MKAIDHFRNYRNLLPRSILMTINKAFARSNLVLTKPYQELSEEDEKCG